MATVLVLVGLVGLALVGCAMPTALLLPDAPTDPEAALRTRLIGTWQGEVDLTFPERTLVVHRVRREDGRWMAEIEYGTTGVQLSALAAVVETGGAQAALAFVTPLASTVRLTLDGDGVLRGHFRLPNETRDRVIELKRVSATPLTPSTVADRLSRAAVRSQPGPPASGAPTGGVTAAGAAAPPAPRVRPSLEREVGVSLPRLLVGRWEGELDFTVSARLLMIDAVRREAGKWIVQARHGVADANLTPVDVTIDTSEDQIVLRFNTALASRATLTLHADDSLRGSFRMAFEARDRRLDLRRVAIATTPGGGPEPLAVAFRHPSDQTRVADPALIVTAVINSGRGVAGVEVALNGAEVHRQDDAARPKSVVVSVPLTLREGPNVVTITARETDGTVRQDVRTVFYERSGQTLAGPPPAALTRERWAVVIGVGQYDHQGVPRLAYAAADAEAVYRTLTGPGGFKKENVLLLSDRTERKPTLRNIRFALGTFLARSARKDDTVIIFFAGHGAPEVDLRGAERDGLAKYLIPADADPDDLYATALPMDELRTIFERIEAERIVAFLDTCYSGAAGGRSFASQRTRAGHVDDLFLERLGRAKGRAIITASRPSEVSLELPELGHGIFTYYLVEGLRGAADLNRDGIVALQELYEYTERQVTAKSRSVGGNQHPVMKGELEGQLPLMKVAP